MDPNHHGPGEDLVFTVDGEEMTRAKAHKLSRRMFQFGFAFLPLLWIMNVWLFWPDLRAGVDPVLTKYTKRSAVGAVISSILFLPWFFFYVTSGSKYLSQHLYDAVDVTRFPITEYIGI